MNVACPCLAHLSSYSKTTARLPVLLRPYTHRLRAACGGAAAQERQAERSGGGLLLPAPQLARPVVPGAGAAARVGLAAAGRRERGSEGEGEGPSMGAVPGIGRQARARGCQQAEGGVVVWRTRCQRFGIQEVANPCHLDPHPSLPQVIYAAAVVRPLVATLLALLRPGSGAKKPAVSCCALLCPAVPCSLRRAAPAS